MRIVKAFIGVHVLVFVGVGAFAMAAPGLLSECLDIRLTSSTAIADFRAMYGGLSLAFGLAFIRALRDSEWVRPALFLIMASSLCLASGRLLTWLTSSPLSPMIAFFMIMEVVSAGLALVIMRDHDKKFSDPLVRNPS